MSRADCLRALGVDRDASWETIRQAYKDLVRVWHPDRFQSDPQLRDRAERQLQKINESYFALKNWHIFEANQPDPAPQPKPAGPGPASNVRARPRGGAGRFRWHLQFRRPLKVAWLGVVCLAPLVIGCLLVNALRIPTLESAISQNGLTSPAILTPSRSAGSLDGMPATAEALSSWARGEAADLWNSIPKIGERPSQTPNGAVPQRDGQPRPRDAGTAAPGTPENGAELLRPRMSGGSELWLSNPANQDAVAKLVEADTTSPARIIYIQAKNKVCIRHIAPGVYDLLAELGENWDPDRVRFQTRRRVLARSGPYQCFDVTSGQGTYGPKFHILLAAR